MQINQFHLNTLLLCVDDLRGDTGMQKKAKGKCTPTAPGGRADGLRYRV